jgi:hypothetical protein
MQRSSPASSTLRSARIPVLAALLCPALLLAAAACGGDRSDAATARAGEAGREPAGDTAALAAAAPPGGTAGTAAATAPAVPPGPFEPNELGLIPVLEYHLIEEGDGMWRVAPERFRDHLQLLYDRGWRPASIAEIVDRELHHVPYGYAVFAMVFDDASPSQFRYSERPDGTLEIDPTSAVGIWLDFARDKPDWRHRAVFCMLPAAQAGRSFFGDRGIEGQKSEWRFPKVRFLAEQGFELCNHTLYHARLDRAGDRVQEYIARGDLAIDSAVPGYRVRTHALPLGMWPQERSQAWQGSWTDPRSGRTIEYRYDAVLEVAGGPNVSPYDPRFNGHSINRVIVHGNELERTLDRLERNRSMYVSNGNPDVIARPAAAPQEEE